MQMIGICLFCKQKTEYDISVCLVGSEMCRRYRCCECNRIKSDRTLNELKTIFEKNFSHKLIRGMFFFEFLGLTSEDILLTKHSERDGITFY